MPAKQVVLAAQSAPVLCTITLFLTFGNSCLGACTAPLSI